jgi:hypothetical protein
MCYDQKSSFTAWIIGFLAGTLLFLRNRPNDRWIGMFVIIFTGIQYVEYKIWQSIDDNKPKNNEYWTKVALLNLWMQAIALTIGAFVWGHVTANTKVYFMLLLFAFVFMVLFMIKAVNSIIDREKTFKTVIGPNGHLVWRQYDTHEGNATISGYFIDKDYTIFAGLVYLIGLFLPHLFMVQETRVVSLILFGLITFLYSHINYWASGEFSSMWCYMSVIYSLIAWV